ncbi:MAG TPA: ferredoxin--NADP reductase [Mycobacteriales bacterium]|nr:ferredoxin--NADP reductase [Mycobacteriales bacterium]HWA65733.1 ferredoxin--NADP reductase [Mycobacteriales bacterium]
MAEAARSDRYHDLAVQRVVRETADAISIGFDVPADLADRYTYRPGQFVTIRAVVDGVPHLRSYSMSSAPETDLDLQVTVKRVPDGPVSCWLHDSVAVGDVLPVSVPAGAFLLPDSEADLVMFAAGSGITPILSMVKSVLHGSSRRVSLLFANRDRDSAIFGSTLDMLAAQFPERLDLHHHSDAASGFVSQAMVSSFADAAGDREFYVCGPTGFMEVVQAGLARSGVATDCIHIERFTPAALPQLPPFAVALVDSDEERTLTITVGSETKTVSQRDKLTILESARWNGMSAPSSCEAGHCATCMAQVVEGEVSMAVNDILTDEEVEAGWVLTCQTVPVSPVVRVVYET